MCRLALSRANSRICNYLRSMYVQRILFLTPPRPLCINIFFPSCSTLSSIILASQCRCSICGYRHNLTLVHSLGSGGKGQFERRCVRVCLCVCICARGVTPHHRWSALGETWCRNSQGCSFWRVIQEKYVIHEVAGSDSRSPCGVLYRMNDKFGWAAKQLQNSWYTPHDYLILVSSKEGNKLIYIL